MKPALEHLPKEPGHSFVVRNFDYSYYPTPWHYHPEYEIVLVTESTGKRFIGDHLSDFGPGNLAFLGPNLPHHYRNDDRYYEAGSVLRAKSIVVHFTEASLGKDFLELPEAARLRKLFERSLCGLDINGKTHRKVCDRLHEMSGLAGLKRWLCLVDILLEIAESGSVTAITKSPLVGYNEKESRRLGDVFDWIMANFEHDIRLSEAAAIAEMNENAFSRFFSLRTRKTFSGFVQELRLQKAARLLIENELSVTEVCYECGYNNISNFNRQFLHHYHMNPMKYRRTFLKGK
ncbi:helix-turn-helix domain-containing protein [Chitinophaga cymbidii]|uniref:AraC family transcriptional regulator n=1 Tax=Chitinophaga cymbidii TaxID=1096750 RepID=A0A512RFR2_9BACT|nr:AraC family transcriptional regulator [Chitinophaga cymbidii]GEP94549.1 AraC family transcriptional regulator [Chitinophaga cymbidii]